VSARGIDVEIESGANSKVTRVGVRSEPHHVVEVVQEQARVRPEVIA
jgi:hypothetical protein